MKTRSGKLGISQEHSIPFGGVAEVFKASTKPLRKDVAQCWWCIVPAVSRGSRDRSGSGSLETAMRPRSQ